MAIKVGIIGATGYAGETLVEILLSHPSAVITVVQAMLEKARPLGDIFPRFKGKTTLVCKTPYMKEIVGKCDLVFLALPHTVSMKMAPFLIKEGKSVIDLSADYRLRDLGVYAHYYKTKHSDPRNIRAAVYGLPELYRNKIKKSRFIANPGCYPTAAILGLAPLAALSLIESDSIIIDAKSGITGAGRTLNQDLLFGNVNENFKAYKVNVHQHAPEISQELSKLFGRKSNIVFVPHILPLNKGILETIYVRKNARLKRNTADLINLYRKFYKDEPFVRIRDEGVFPQLRDVVDTNFCDIGIKADAKNIIIVAAIDNLLKGASGQAVQNMNIMYNIPEKTALI